MTGPQQHEPTELERELLHLTEELSRRQKRIALILRIGTFAALGGTLLVLSSTFSCAPPLHRIAPGDIRVERYPWLQVPEQAPVDEVFEVIASLQVEPPDVLVNKHELILPDQDEWRLSVILEAPDFDIVDGEAMRTVIMGRDDPSEPAIFLLRARSDTVTVRPGDELTVAASFWFENRLLVRVSEAVTMGTTLTTMQLPEEKVEPLTFEWEREEADLQVTLFDRFMVLSAPEFGPPLPLEIPRLSPEDREALEQLYAELEAVSTSRNLGPRPEDRKATEDARARATAVSIGRLLWQRLAPTAFQDTFWALADDLGDDFNSLQIYADDPSIPWELMRPSREGPDGVEERDFLGLDFDIARGSPRGGRLQRMPVSVPLESIWVLRPDYQPPLLGTALEVEALQAFDLVPPQILPSTYEELTRVTQDLPNGILHFAGHGVELHDGGAAFAVILSGEEQVTVNEWLGLLPAPRLRNHPFVFFNACSVGKTRQSLGFAEGWAPAFLEAGASGYLGTLWPVGDQAAARFAGRFYETLEADLADGGGSPARAAREARRLYREDPDPTYLAYVLYGETDLELTLR